MLAISYYDEVIRVEADLSLAKKNLRLAQQSNLRNDAKNTDLKFKTIDKAKAVELSK